MDPTAPLSTQEFDIFAFLCKFRKDLLIGEAAGGFVLLSILISMIATCVRNRKKKKLYKIKNTRRSIIVTDEEDEFPPHPRLDTVVPLTSTPFNSFTTGTWVWKK